MTSHSFSIMLTASRMCLFLQVIVSKTAVNKDATATSIQEIDWSMGELLTTLKKHNLEENTLIIFTSDNGPWLSYGNHAGSAKPLREGKGTVWEGGVREPFVARWPAKIPAGSSSK